MNNNNDQVLGMFLYMVETSEEYPPQVPTIKRLAKMLDMHTFDVSTTLNQLVKDGLMIFTIAHQYLLTQLGLHKATYCKLNIEMDNNDLHIRPSYRVERKQ